MPRGPKEPPEPLELAAGDEDLPVDAAGDAEAAEALEARLVQLADLRQKRC